MKTCFGIFAAAFLLTALHPAVAQNSAALPNPIGSERDGDALETQARKSGDLLIPTCRFEGARCGYIDRAGSTVIAPQFDWTDRFFAGRALVGKDQKYGAIDETGKLVIPAIYDRMSRFDRDAAQALVGRQLGVLNDNGEWILPAQYGFVIRLSDDVFLVAEPPHVDARWPMPLQTLGDPLSRSSPYAHGKRWGIVARGGTWVVPPTFAQVRAFSKEPDGLFWAANSASSDAQWQLMRADGTAVSGAVFDHVQQIQPGEDRAVVHRGQRWGAINGKGEIVVELKYDRLSYYRDGWAPYRLDGQEGRIDRDGNILSSASIQPNTLDRNAKLGAVVDGKPLFTDKAGTTLLGTDHPRCPDGRHLRFAAGRWMIVTADDRPVPDTAFQYVQLACANASIVKHDGKWGFIAADGALLADRYFDQAHAFHNGIATVTDNQLWAVIGEDGRFLLGPLKLARSVLTSGTGAYEIELEDGYRPLDLARTAELARDPATLTRPLPPRRPMSEGLAAVLDAPSGKWGYVDISGQFLIAPQFDAVNGFRNGGAWAAHPDRRAWCRIDKAGRLDPQIPCRCEQPLVIIEHYSRPAGVDCYDDGLRIVRGLPMRGPN